MTQVIKINDLDKNSCSIEDISGKDNKMIDDKL